MSAEGSTTKEDGQEEKQELAEWEVAKRLRKKLRPYLVLAMTSTNDAREREPPNYSLAEIGLMNLLLATAAQRMEWRDQPDDNPFVKGMRHLAARLSLNQSCFMASAEIALLYGLLDPITAEELLPRQYVTVYDDE